MTTIVNWDGTQEHLPPAGQPFFYKDGDNLVWRPCNCSGSCQRPIAYRLKDGKMDYGMSVRLRGKKQGNALYDFLAAVDLEKLIAIGPNWSKIMSMFREATARLNISRANIYEAGTRATLTRLGIPTKRMIAAFLQFDGVDPIIAAAITDAFAD